MTRERQLRLSLHGAVCLLESDQVSFITYARHTLEGLFEHEAGRPPAQASVRSGTQQDPIHVCLHWNASPPGEWRGRQARQWGRRLLQLGQEVLQAEVAPLPGLQIVAGWSAGGFKIEAYYRPTSRLEKLSLRFERGRQRVFNILLYYLVYFPFIHYLEQTRGWYLAHAAALSHPHGGILLAGLPGGGKTTFSLGLLAGPQVQILSDNLILFTSGQVYALPEPIHLSLESWNLLAQPVRDRLTATGRRLSYQRHVYDLASGTRTWQTQPRLLFFTGLSGEHDCRPVSTPVALERWLAFDGMAKEYNAYAQFAAPLGLVAPQAYHAERRQSALEALVSGLDCYELWLEKGADLEQACQMVDEILPGKVSQWG